MKNITGGSPDCQWGGCGQAAMYYNCLTSKCTEWYGFSNETISCQKTVGSAHKNMVALCNTDYQ
jgi:hypothetical protein